ncbi:hypothetical protein [Chryseolinea lacunae]|uniref:PsbP C-terminal domain-containing protein n=1 Tax=Chryseolinea lacunae TaxID=2801331 RepID=A0ABS1KPP5_9BACT|nr:hypothetical protein [Chryseolinea lacunae]MBL0741193.1 hypothetical protein [Chryseolinea lacunae]
MLKIKSGVLLRLSLVVFVAFVAVAAVKPKLMKVKVNDAITVSVPNEWRPMDDMDFNERYPSIRAPLAAYTNNEREVDFSVNISATQWPDADLPLAQKFFRAGVMNMFDRVEMIEEGIHEVGGKKFIFFEFDSRINGSKKQEGLKDPVMRYTYIQYLLLPGQTLVFSFNCPKRLKADWQETARLMMTSIKIKAAAKK